MSIMFPMLKHVIHSNYSKVIKTDILLRTLASEKQNNKPLSPRMKEFKEKLKKSPPPTVSVQQADIHPDQDKSPFPPFPENTNPQTGEVNGPRGPEPTRFGDWERKGRVSDF